MVLFNEDRSKTEKRSPSNQAGVRDGSPGKAKAMHRLFEETASSQARRTDSKPSSKVDYRRELKIQTVDPEKFFSHKRHLQYLWQSVGEPSIHKSSPNESPNGRDAFPGSSLFSGTSSTFALSPDESRASGVFFHQSSMSTFTTRERYF